MFGEKIMKMTLEQTQLVGLTMQLDLETQNYKKLCEELEKLKEQNLDPNDEKYAVLKKKFEKNLAKIKKINAELKKLNKESA